MFVIISLKELVFWSIFVLEKRQEIQSGYKHFTSHLTYTVHHTTLSLSLFWNFPYLPLSLSKNVHTTLHLNMVQNPRPKPNPSINTTSPHLSPLLLFHLALISHSQSLSSYSSQLRSVRFSSLSILYTYISVCICSHKCVFVYRKLLIAIIEARLSSTVRIYVSNRDYRSQVQVYCVNQQSDLHFYVCDCDFVLF